MFAQVVRSHGGIRKANDFLAALGLCLTESQCSKREEDIVQAAVDEGVIPLWLETIAVAFDNCDMKAVMNLIGSQYGSFIASTAMGTNPVHPPRRQLRLCSF